MVFRISQPAVARHFYRETSRFPLTGHESLDIWRSNNGLCAASAPIIGRECNDPAGNHRGGRFLRSWRHVEIRAPPAAAVPFITPRNGIHITGTPFIHHVWKRALCSRRRLHPIILIHGASIFIYARLSPAALLTPPRANSFPRDSVVLFYWQRPIRGFV